MAQPTHNFCERDDVEESYVLLYSLQAKEFIMYQILQNYIQQTTELRDKIPYLTPDAISPINDFLFPAHKVFMHKNTTECHST